MPAGSSGRLSHAHSLGSKPGLARGWGERAGDKCPPKIGSYKMIQRAKRWIVKRITRAGSLGVKPRAKGYDGRDNGRDDAMGRASRRRDGLRIVYKAMLGLEAAI